MKGTITTRHLLTQAPRIIRCFGLAAYLRCVVRTLRGDECTFLGCTVKLDPR